MPETILNHFSQTAASQRRLAETATSERERAHYALEAERFEELATMDPSEARRVYRPARAYEPAA